MIGRNISEKQRHEAENAFLRPLPDNMKRRGEIRLNSAYHTESILLGNGGNVKKIPQKHRKLREFLCNCDK